MMDGLLVLHKKLYAKEGHQLVFLKCHKSEAPLRQCPDILYDPRIRQ